MRFIPIILILFALAAVGCASIYETDSDQRSGWIISEMDAANGRADELAPVPTSRGLYFTSNREVAGEELDRLYLLPTGDANSSKALHVRTSNAEIKAGAITFLSGSDTRLLYVECYREDGFGDCDIVEGRLSSDGLSIENISLLDTAVNDIEWDHHPTLSADGNTLVFASERFGGNGGSDLWMSTQKGGRWSTAVNLGERINTSGNEITPCLSPAGDELYFSSDAHPGRGGFDIFMSRLVNGTWTAPQTVGQPFNSEDDDIFFRGTLDADTLYFASNRTGGKGGFDIYEARRKILTPPPPPPVVPKEKPLVLRVRAKNSYTMQDIPAQVSISAAADDRVLADGTGTAETRLDLEKSYTVTGEHSGFINAVETVRFGGADEVTKLSSDEGQRMVITHDLLLVPITEEERKIYAFTVEFDFNLFNIRPEEERKLDSVVILLAQFPNSTVVFSGHTDSVGTTIYNIKLGYNRAQEVSRYVGDWLKEKGVRLQNPIEIRTYGEAEPVAPNSTDEGRQRNRRVEIAIVRNK